MRTLCVCARECLWVQACVCLKASARVSAYVRARMSHKAVMGDNCDNTVGTVRDCGHSSERFYGFESSDANINMRSETHTFTQTHSRSPSRVLTEIHLTHTKNEYVCKYVLL